MSDELYYDPELKERAISMGYSKNEQNALSLLFKKSKIYEDIYNKDIHSFTKYEIIDFLKSLSSSSVASIRVKTSYLRRYAQMCIEEGLSVDGINHFNEIVTEDLEKCVNTSIGNAYIDRSEIVDLCENILTNDNEKFLVLGLYEGLSSNCDRKYEEIGLTLASGIKTKSILLYTGRELTVSDLLIKYARQSANQKEWNNIDGTYEGNAIVDISYGRIYNPRSNSSVENNLPRRIRTRIQAINRVTKLNISISSLQLSGMSYMIKSLAKSRGIVDMSIDNVLSTLKYDIEYNKIISRYGYSKMTTSRLKSTLRGYI